MSGKVFTEADCDRSVLRERIAVLGFGNQGRAQALNLTDSGCEVRIGARKTIPEFESMSVSEATGWASTVVMCLPDAVTATIYSAEIAPFLQPNTNVIFCHGYNVQYGLVQIPDTCDGTLCAPSGTGTALRSAFEAGGGIPCLVATHQDANGNALRRVLSYAWAIGCSRAAIFESTFSEETETDLFGEQAVLCGGLMGLCNVSFETLVRAGYSPEIAYNECVMQLEMLAGLVKKHGVAGMLAAVSDTARWGAFETQELLFDAETRAKFQKLLENIQSGQFAAQWNKEFFENNRKELNAKLDAQKAHPSESVGKKLRSLLGL